MKKIGARKILLTMKLLICIIIASVAQAFAADALAQKVNFSGENVSVKDVLSVIEKQTGYLFFYKESLLEDASPVSVDFSDKSVSEVMDEICASQQFSWSVEKQTITLVPKPERVAPKISVAESEFLAPPVMGRVTDMGGKPLPGATVLIKGTAHGTTTDNEGNFSVEAKNGDVLVISFVGYATKEVLVGDVALSIKLKEEISGLDEVQVIGYGKVTKRYNTGSVATIKGAVLDKQPVTNVLQALQGRVSGVSISQSDGAVGSEQKILIRGVNSIMSGRSPLFIVDGVIIDNQSRSAGGFTAYVSPYNWLNPDDIASIDVLKDADATSIYGSRGTNGVILITTKKAVLGETHFTVNASTGFNMASYITPRLNLNQYLQYRKDAFAMGNVISPSEVINPININENPNLAPDLKIWDQSANTNWGNYEFGKNGQIHNLEGTFSGGTKLFNFTSSLGYFKQEDIQFGDPYQERMISRLNMHHTSINEKLNVDLTVHYNLETMKPSQGTYSLAAVQRNPPNMPSYNDDGSFYWGNMAFLGNNKLNFPEPVKVIENKYKGRNFLASADISYNLSKGLNFKTMISYADQITTNRQITPNAANNPFMPMFFAANITSSNNYFSLNIEPQLTYTGDLFGGKITTLLGSTFLQSESRGTYFRGSGFSSDLVMKDLSQASEFWGTTTSNFYRFTSLFGRLNYIWKDKYIANATFRRDGSSRFGPENKFGNYGSLGLAWLFSSEQFVKDVLPFISFGKLRGSYGITGNDAIGDYQYLSLWTPSYYNGINGLEPSILENPYYSWESTKKMDATLELGFFNSRILLNTTFYNTISDKQLVGIPVPQQTGFDTYMGNSPATVRNRGWEFELTTNNLRANSKLSWKTNFNLTFLQNRLLKFPDLDLSFYAGLYQIGRELPSDLMLEMPFIYTGVDPANGLPLFKDVDNDGMISYSDRGTNEAWIGSSIPKIYGGFGNTFEYKNFTLDVFVEFAKKLMTDAFFNSPAAGQFYNPPADLWDNYWKKPGDVTKYPRLYTGYSSYPQNVNEYNAPLRDYYNQSSAFIVNQFYFRLKNVALTYTLPSSMWGKNAKTSKMVVFLKGNNLAFYTKRKLFKDPELGSYGNTPMLRTWTAGVQVTF